MMSFTTRSAARVATALLSVTALAMGTALVSPASAGTTPAQAAHFAPAKQSRAIPVLASRDGRLAGVRIKNAEAFLGVPYAAPPTKQNRFRAPQPVKPWRSVRDATRQAPACLQFQPTGVREEQATSEDCLYLDVYRPAGTRRGDRLPIMIWYHGGAWTQGSGVIYGGQTMAARTNTIVISINYRLGALGLLSLPSLDQQQPRTLSGNYALLDQIQAIKWAIANARALGGDAKNVTIFGQSAGGAAVCSVLTSPLAKGLVQRAIIQSFGCTGMGASPRATAHATGQKFADAAGCPAGANQVACLRSAWAPKLVAASMTQMVNSATSGTPVLPLAPSVALATGKWNKVPIITGNALHEGRLLATDQVGLTAAGYSQLVRQNFGANADRILATYPLANYASPFHAYAELFGDMLLTCPVDTMARTLSTQTRVWRYEFNDPTSPTLYGFQPIGVDMSNAHSAELAYLFDFTLGDRPLTASELRLSRQMQRYWGAFAWSGNPNSSGQTRWPQYTASGDRVLSLRPTGSVVVTDTAQRHHCDLWDSISGG